jgi:hypothetical protein
MPTPAPQLSLAVDGKVTPNPDDEKIRQGFESIDRSQSGISMVDLHWDDRHYLGASGHPAEGWYHLEHREGTTQFLCFPDRPLPTDELIRIFQAAARHDFSWRSRFHWDEEEVHPPGRIERWTTRLFEIAFCLGIGFFVLLMVVMLTKEITRLLEP